MVSSIRSHYPEAKLSNGPIQKVEPLSEGVLRIYLETGSVIDIPLSVYFSEARFYPLNDEKVWKNADTNERFVHWYRDGIEVVEVGWDELVSFALGPRWV